MRSIVLENALALNDEEAIHKICDRLKMEFINLPRRGSGSLVQTCTRASKYGMKSVVESLLQASENTLLELASERFGTYVIQVALILTRTHDVELYELLAASLKPLNFALSLTKYGTQVNLMMEAL
ncbi:uncharacterized protein LOC115999422 [Ipomoea triloba]|uniref:uncharacterized protein LOC115999422 n=1 Tax=Ipomoea triloba TaxID=35885 RepID=UPI00125E0401|nr:uncharacterized protein LOC115999422 [Ipomoea triloba]